MTENTDTDYIYIVQAALEKSKCKIGKTNDLERRLKEYNNINGKSNDNIYQYLFTCEVSDSPAIENAIKEILQLAKNLKAKRELEIQSGQYGFQIKHKNTNFSCIFKV